MYSIAAIVHKLPCYISTNELFANSLHTLEILFNKNPVQKKVLLLGKHCSS